MTQSTKDMHRSRISKLILLAALFFVFAQLSGCGHYKLREQLRGGMLSKQLQQKTFLDVWGKPTRTSVQSGAKVMEAGIGRHSGYFFKGNASYEMWEYEDHEVILVFRGRRLVDWKTDKTVRELDAITPETDR